MELLLKYHSTSGKFNYINLIWRLQSTSSSDSILFIPKKIIQWILSSLFFPLPVICLFCLSSLQLCSVHHWMIQVESHFRKQLYPFRHYIMSRTNVLFCCSSKSYHCSFLLTVLVDNHTSQLMIEVKCVGSNRVSLNDLLQQIHSEIAVHLTLSSLASISFGTMNNGFNKKLHTINTDLCLAPELLTHCEFEERVEEGMGQKHREVQGTHLNMGRSSVEQSLERLQNGISGFMSLYHSKL